jgi:hypothetical protein
LEDGSVSSKSAKNTSDSIDGDLKLILVGIFGSICGWPTVISVIFLFLAALIKSRVISDDKTWLQRTVKKIMLFFKWLPAEDSTPNFGGNHSISVGRDVNGGVSTIEGDNQRDGVHIEGDIAGDNQRDGVHVEGDIKGDVLAGSSSNSGNGGAITSTSKTFNFNF